MRYRVTGYTKIEVETFVEADSEEDAKQIAKDREVMICVHGTSSCGWENEGE